MRRKSAGQVKNTVARDYALLNQHLMIPFVWNTRAQK